MRRRFSLHFVASWLAEKNNESVLSDWLEWSNQLKHFAQVIIY